MRRMVWAVATVGLVAAAACGKASESANTTTTAATTSSAVDAPFNAGLCQTSLDARKGANATVPPGGCVISPGKTYAMVMESSGELKVAPVTSGGTLGPSIWSSNTRATTPGSSATAFQEDGNLVVYDQPGNKPTWASASSGPLEAYHLALDDQGDLLITQVSTGKTKWSTKTGLTKDGAAAPAAAPANAAT